MSFKPSQLVHIDENPSPPETVPFRLFAIIHVWNEEDIIFSTVKHLQEQGVEKIFIIDNGSDDNTIAEAEAAGAILWGSYRTINFIENMKVRKINNAIKSILADCTDEHVWILCIDADEFPVGPNGMRIIDFLSGLDKRFRVVGSHWVNHTPLYNPHYIERFHPLDFQPFGKFQGDFHQKGVCVAHHDKHQILRFDKNAPAIFVGAGFHWFSCKQLLTEPLDSLICHHFNYRDFSATKFRLEKLQKRLSLRNDVAKKKSGEKDKVDYYVTRLDNLSNNYNPENAIGAFISTDQISGSFSSRWYSSEDLHAAVSQKESQHTYFTWALCHTLAIRDMNEFSIFLKKCLDKEPHDDLRSLAQHLKAIMLLQFEGKTHALEHASRYCMDDKRDGLNVFFKNYFHSVLTKANR